jgi:uncharacterized protein
MNDYYVYVYIDPRNHEEFYFGKGRGSRKKAHLADASDTRKTQRIAAIRKAGLEPIVRVIARGLSEHDALLVEKTLLWKLGRNLTNVSSGHYADKFRPHNTIHLELSGFDYRCGLYNYIVGEGPHRCWDDYREFGFISAGQGRRWREAMLGFEVGDVFAAYLSRHGWVGIGVITAKARPVRDVKILGKPLLGHALRRARMAENAESDLLSEYVATVRWERAVDRKDALWKRKSDLFANQQVRASLSEQRKTIAFLEEGFKLQFSDLLRSS